MGRDQFPWPFRSVVFLPLWLLAVVMLFHPTRRIVLAWRNSSPLLFKQQQGRSYRHPRGPPRGSFFATAAVGNSRQRPSLVRGLASESFSRRQEPQLLQEDSGVAASDGGADATADSLVYKELQWVAAELRKHDALYYNDVDSALDDTTATAADSLTKPITDAEYDALAEREAELCQAHPELWHRLQAESGLGPRATRYKGRVGAVHADSDEEDEEEEEDNVVVAPSVAAGIYSSNRLKQAHLKPMLSLDNVHSTDQLVAWLERVRKKLLASSEGEEEDETTVTIVTEPKLDGLSLSLRYELISPDGDSGGGSSSYDLKWACTRGDGRKGTDVTRAVQEMGTVPTRFRMEEEASTELPDVVEVRGEVVLPHSVFEKLLNDQGTAKEDGDAGSGSPSILASFSNARNAASGILLRFKDQQANDVDNTDDDASLTESQELRAKLRFYAYNVVTSSEEAATDPLVQNGLETRRILDALGFTTPDPISITTLTLPSNDTESWSETDISTMIDYYEALRKYRQEGKAGSSSKKASSESYEWGDFEVDGCVHKIAEESLRTRLGSSTRAPRWAVAHKFPPTAVVTDLLGIDVQVGRTGALTPVAILKPVEIGGVTVQRATLHNFPQMQHMLGGVDRVVKGSSVMVRRAGDVIPQVVSRVSSSLEIEKSANTDGSNSTDFISLQTPSSCPVCGSMASFDERNATSSRNESSIGQVLRCRGPPLLCPPRAIGALRHAFARDALDIKGLSEKRIEQLMDAGFLERPSDIFTLANDDAKLEELAGLAGWGEKSVSKLAVEVKRVASEGVTLARFIYSLGIHLSGRHASPLIAEAYGTVDAFLKDLEKTSELDDMEKSPFMRLDSIKGIGPVLLTSIWDFASQKELVVAARQLAQSVRILDETGSGTSSSGPSSGTGSGTTDSTEDGGGSPLSGLSVVFTGTLPGLTRSEAKKLAKEMGAKSTPGTVSKSTGLVVLGEKEGIKKVEQAQKLGVRLIDGDEFLKMVDAFRGGKSD